MLVKTHSDELQNYLTDASNLSGGYAEKVYVPETAQEIAEILKQANESRIPVTISGARTGIAGGAVPFGGYLISLENFNRIKEIIKDENGGRAISQAGVLLTDFQKRVESEGLFYPPDPTEWSCQLGGTVATNASGSRSFKYGATRKYVERLEIVLPTGEIINLRRGETLGRHGKLRFPVSDCGEVLVVKLPTYDLPHTRKNTSGYFNHENIDAIDLFIGSEGTLGVVTEIEFKLLAKPAGFLSGIVFFKEEKNLLDFVKEARALSFEAREAAAETHLLDATLLEYFDEKALNFVKEKFPDVPDQMAGAIFFEQETTSENEDSLFERWSELLEKHHAETDSSWFTTTDADREKMRAFRHQLPVSVNEWIVRHRQRKISTDIAVPDENFASMLKFYKNSLKQSALNYVIFGHIGDNHLHVNILPKDEAEAKKARQLYGRFVAQAVMLGGTISAEHGIGKIKSKYLYVQYGERYLNEMAELKRTFDPRGILGRGNIFDTKFLLSENG